MTTSTSLVPIAVEPSTALLPTERQMDMIDRAAAMVWAGAVALPKELNTQAKVAAVMLYGLELGLKPMTAINHLYIVNGRVAASAQVMVGMCMQRERDIEFHVERLDDSICTIRFNRPSRRVSESYTVTWAMIERAKLNRDNNLLYPEDRLMYHCVKRLCRLYAPDLINNMDEGVYVAGVEPVDEGPDAVYEEPAIDNADLYNDGDRVVDRATGEIIEQAPAQAPQPVQSTAPQRQAAPARSTGQDGASGTLAERVHKSMLRTRDEFPTDWPRNWKTLNERFGWKGDALAYKKLNAADAAECLRMLRGMRGEAEPEDMDMVNETPDKPAEARPVEVPTEVEDDEEDDDDGPDEERPEPPASA